MTLRHAARSTCCCDDLATLVAVGLLEPSPDGHEYALTDLGRETPEFGD